MRQIKTHITIDERHYALLETFGDKVNLTIFFQMDNKDWVLQGGALLTKEVAANFGLSLIDRSGKDREILKKKYQRPDGERFY